MVDGDERQSASRAPLRPGESDGSGHTRSSHLDEHLDRRRRPELRGVAEIENPISLSRVQVGSGGSAHEIVRLRVEPLPQPFVKPWTIPRPVRVTAPVTAPGAPPTQQPGAPPGFQGGLTFHHEFALFATPMREEGLFPESANAPAHPHRTTRYSGSASFTGQLRMDTANRYYALLFPDRIHAKNTGLPEPEIVHACETANGRLPPSPRFRRAAARNAADPGDCPTLGQPIARSSRRSTHSPTPSVLA